MRQAEGGIAGDRALAVQDPGHAIRGDLDSACELRCAHVQGTKLFGQVLTRMNRDGSSCDLQFADIDELHVRRSWRCFWPFKTDSPVLVNADGIWCQPPSPDACFETSTLEGFQVLERVDGCEPVEREPHGALDAGQRLDAFPGGEHRHALTPIADDHAQKNFREMLKPRCQTRPP